jgi:hypothetical protein
MKSTNKKASRTLDCLANILRDLPDKKIKHIHGAINDKRDGYNFDFISAVNSYRSLCGSDKPSVS